MAGFRGLFYVAVFRQEPPSCWCEDDIYWSIDDVDKNPVLTNQYISLDHISYSILTVLWSTSTRLCVKPIHSL